MHLLQTFGRRQDIMQQMQTIQTPWILFWMVCNNAQNSNFFGRLSGQYASTLSYSNLFGYQDI